MVLPKKITNQVIRAIGGQPCLVLIGENGKEFYVPAAGMQMMFDNAMQQLNAFAAQNGISAGQWRHALIATPQTWNTGTTDAGKVAVIVDRGLPTEQTFALSSDHAAGLGQQLVETAAKAPTAPKLQ